MQYLKNVVKLKDFCFDSRLLDVRSPSYIQVATVMKLVMPPTFEDVEYPPGERRRLRMFEKVPQPFSSGGKVATMRKMKYLMRGPEQVHNTLLYGDCGIQATSGGRLEHGHIEAMRIKMARKLDESRMFAMWRIDGPWQAISKKGISHRMGGGKGNINKYVVPIRADRMILEIGGKCEFIEVKHILRSLAQILPFEARVVTRESLEAEKQRKEQLEKMNKNPFTFKYAAEKNMLGIDKYLSPYDYIWHGKYK